MVGKLNLVVTVTADDVVNALLKDIRKSLIQNNITYDMLGQKLGVKKSRVSRMLAEGSNLTMKSYFNLKQAIEELTGERESINKLVAMYEINRNCSEVSRCEDEYEKGYADAEVNTLNRVIDDLKRLA